MFTIFLNVFFIGLLHGQSFQQIRGIVRDKSSGAPLEYATVLVHYNPSLGTTTDSLGQFILRDIPVGRYDVQASFVGYEPVLIKEVLLSAAKEVFLEIGMSENVHSLGEVTVRPQVNKSQSLNAMALGSARMLSVEEAGRYAGGFDDPARLASAFAGVASSVGNNGIVVRGNSPKSLQWRLVDVEIPNPNHFADVTTFGGGGMTAFSSQLLGNSDFFTGAFPAEYGNALSGVFDMNLRTGNNRKREHTFQFGAIGIDFASEGPFREGGNASYLFNYRYSTLALLSSVLPANAGGVRYQDLSFKFNFPSRKASVFSLWGIGLIDHSGQIAIRDSLQWLHTQDKEEQNVEQYMGAAGLNHKLQLNSQAYLKTSLAATVSHLDFRTEQLDAQYHLQPLSAIRNTQWNLVFSSYLNRKFSARHTNKTGIRITGFKYDYTDTSDFSALLSAYSQSAINLSDSWMLNLGINAQVFSLNSRYTLEPRAALRWKFKPGHSAGLAYGLHSRMETLYYQLDFTRAHHLVATYDWQLSGDYHLRIEPYVQQLFRVPVIADSSFSFINLQRDWFITERLENSGEGFNYGIDLTFEKYMSRGYYYMLTASLFDSRYKGGDGVWRNTRYNRCYVFNFLSGKEWLLGRNRQNIFGANIRLSYQGGDRYSPLDVKASEESEAVVYLEQQAFSKQYPPALLCHFTLSYKMNKRQLSHEFALKVINATLNQEYLGHQYNLKTHQLSLDSEVVVVPNISYKIEF
jgi:hypothetical protein